MKIRSVESLTDSYLETAMASHVRWLQRRLTGLYHDEKGQEGMRRAQELGIEISRRLTLRYVHGLYNRIN